MKVSQIRARFLEFFAEHGHAVVTSSTLVPQDDPTLLFTNAGMNQFKAVFTGVETRGYKRATSVQKCMRVSGKHNDLEEVGKDARHHTFFEMLGNWSFGDYYKNESLRWGYDFLIKEMGLDGSRVWYSVYKDDDEAYDIFHKDLGIPTERIVRLGDIEQGDEENFWSMGDTGPCGPCAEIHFDQGEDMACTHEKGCALGVCDCDRWLELWNHVFMQFDRDQDGKLHPLPMRSVDTGLGLERLAAVMQGVKSNYQTDLFQTLIARTAQLCERKPEGEELISMQVIADHARAVAFTIADGASPSNDGRGYVVRRILRRAARHGHLLGMKRPFLFEVSDTVINEMGDAYPELRERRERILDVIRKEEERFLRTLESGLKIYGDIRTKMTSEGRTQVTGEEAFKLHDTFGFPVDLTSVMAEEDGFTVDEWGFQECMDKQRAQSGKERVFMAGIGVWQPLLDNTELDGRFTGYDDLQGKSAVQAVREGGADDDGPLTHLLFAEAPFYPEGGGQIGDAGVIRFPGGEEMKVLTTVKSDDGPALVVQGDASDLKQKFLDTATVELIVDQSRRHPTMRHHTATHLLHAALRHVLGDHVEQAGSEVTPERLRFDFRHDSPVSRQEIARIEDLVSRSILDNQPVMRRADVPLAEAKEAGAMALFGEKYGDTVRMIEIPGGSTLAPFLNQPDGDTFSLELCGGTHCDSTGDVGAFRITSEGSVAAGVRRIEAVAGEAAMNLDRADRDQMRELAGVLRHDGDAYAQQVQDLRDELQQLRKELQQVQQASAQAGLEDTLAQPRDVAGLKVVSAVVPAEDRDTLLGLGDHVRDKLGTDGVVILGATWGGKATLLVTLTADLVDAKKLHAGNLVKALSAVAGGRGGGRPNTAQAGMPDLAAVEKALAAVDGILTEQLG